MGGLAWLVGDLSLDYIPLSFLVWGDLSLSSGFRV